jgi:hypothetical protein
VRAIRYLVVIAVAAVVGATAVPDAKAVRFADSPCLEAGPLRVCPEAVVGQHYAIKLEGDGGCGPALPYQYRLLNGALPPGVTLSADGHLTGTPTVAGTWDFWVELSDQDPPSASWCRPVRSEREFRIAVGAPAATLGVPYSVSLGAASADALTWSLVSGSLPPGIALDPSGVVAGTPTSPGGYPIVLSAVGRDGQETRIQFTLTVYAPLKVGSIRFPRMRVGRSFRARMPVQGAVGSVSYKVISGRFPTGVRLDAATGLVRGMPHRAGLFRLTVQVADSVGRYATGSIVLTVRTRSSKR